MLTVLIALLPGGQVTTQVWYNTCRHATSRRHSPTGSRRSARRRSTPARRPACGPKVAPPSSVSHKSAGRWHYQMVPEEGLEPSCPGGPDAFKARLSADSSTPAGGAVFEATATGPAGRDLGATAGSAAPVALAEQVGGGEALRGALGRLTRPDLLDGDRDRAGFVQLEGGALAVAVEQRAAVREVDHRPRRPGLDPGLLECPEQVVVLVLEAEHPHHTAARHAGQRHTRLARVVADRVAVRTGPDLADHLEHALLEALGDPHLEGLRLLVHLVPGDAHDLDEERLDQPVAADHVPGHPLALGGEGDALARATLDQALGRQPVDHLGHAGRGVLHRPREVGRGPVDAGLP